MNISVIIPTNIIINHNHKKKKVKYLDSFIGTNKVWESTFFEGMTKETILEKVLNLLDEAKDYLSVCVYKRQFSRHVERKYLSISDTVILGLNSLSRVNNSPYTEIEHKLLNNITNIQREVINLYHNYHALKRVWFN
jgi:hypothetical protein